MRTLLLAASLTFAMLSSASAANLKQVNVTAPRSNGTASGTTARDLGWRAAHIGANQVINRIPAPTGIVSGMGFFGAFSGAANLLIQGIRTSVEGEREMGHGEAHCSVFDTLNPIPFLPIYRWCMNRYSKVDLCSDKAYFSYAKYWPDDSIPAVARQSWYFEKYCNGPHRPEFDVFRKAAGLGPYVAPTKMATVPKPRRTLVQTYAASRPAKAVPQTARGQSRLPWPSAQNPAPRYTSASVQ